MIPAGTGSLGCEVSRSCFEPYEVTVSPGSPVTWTNSDSVMHTIVGGKAPIPDGSFQSGHIRPLGTFEAVFEEPGTYGYFCTLHPWTSGIVTVR